METLVIRTISGLFFLGIIIGSIAFSSTSFALLFLAILIAGMLEFYTIASRTRARPQRITGTIIGVLLYLFSFMYSIGLINIEYFLIFIPFFSLVFITEIYQDSKRPLQNIASTFFGIIYIAVPFALLPPLVFNISFNIYDSYQLSDEYSFDFINDIINYFSLIAPNHSITYSYKVLLGVFILIWTFDTMAYFFGTAMGRHPLFKRISPKKTWEGLFGGTLSTGILVYFVSVFFNELTLMQWICIGLIVIIIGTYGDLTQSLLKRSVSMKDSGKIMPGHGGILDRFDSFLLAYPIVFTYLQLID
jgi:phosphatidate cytidylyltransferase